MFVAVSQDHSWVWSWCCWWRWSWWWSWWCWWSWWWCSKHHHEPRSQLGVLSRSWKPWVTQGWARPPREDSFSEKLRTSWLLGKMVLVEIEDVDLRLIHICAGPEQELQLGEVWVIFWVEAWKTPTWSWDPRSSTDRHQSGWCDLCCPQTPEWQRKELKNTSTWSWEWDLLSEEKNNLCAR